jgi:hypothetical protein
MPSIPFEDILLSLNQMLEFCNAIGLGNIAAQSRFAKYQQRIQRLIEIVRLRQDNQGAISIPREIEAEQREYMGALMESVEFGSLLPYVRQCDPAVVRPKLWHALKGPSLTSAENTHSNQARNVQFELSLAHQLWRAGLTPLLGEHPDLTCTVDETAFLFECKRLFSHSTQVLKKRIRHAEKQLHATRSRLLYAVCGVVAVSLSTLFNPTYKAVPIADEQSGRTGLSMWLREQAENVHDELRALAERRSVVGILFHAASPFFNVTTDRFDFGQYFVGYPFVPEASPSFKAVQTLAASMKAIEY